jgi:cysteine synthase A
MIYNNVISMVGNTPLLKISGFDEENRAELYVKLEKFNPAGSVKDRAALGMLEAAEEAGILKDGSVIIEPTSGNTGIALAMLGRIKGYRVIIIMPDTMSMERRSLISAYGAELVLTEGAKGMKGAIQKAVDMKAEIGEKAFIPQQFINPSNPAKHYQTTAIEIYNDLPEVDAFVAGVGTGGTITGFAQYAKDHGKTVRIIAVEPTTSAVLLGNLPGAHKIQGIGAGFIPDNYSAGLVDEILTVSTEDAFSSAKAIGKELGVLVGISSGASFFAALEVAKKLGKGKKVVTIAPDGGEKYISMGLFE